MSLTGYAPRRCIDLYVIAPTTTLAGDVVTRLYRRTVRPNHDYLYWTCLKHPAGVLLSASLRLVR